MKLKMLVFAGASLFAASAAQAQTVYTDRAAFLAALGGLTTATNTFEENASGGYTSYGAAYTGAGYSIAGASGESYTVDPGFDSFYEWNSGDIFGGNRTDFTFTIGADRSAFGFDFGASSLSGGNGFLTVNGVNYTALGQPTFNFFGVVNRTGGIGPITVGFNGGVAIIDNVIAAEGAVAAVPEPATWGMMILGFGVVGASMRRRKPTVRTSVSFA